MKKYIPNILKSYLLITMIVSIPFVISCKKPGSDPEPVVELKPEPVSEPVKPICRLSKYLEKKQDGTYGGYQYTYNLDDQVIKMDKFLADTTIDKDNSFTVIYEGKKIKKLSTRFKATPMDPVTGLAMDFSYTNDKISSITYGSFFDLRYVYTINGDIEKITLLLVGQERFQIIFSGYLNGRPSEMAVYDYNPNTKAYDYLSEKERYTYDADYNLIKVEGMDKITKSWKLSKEFKYDLKLPLDPMSELLTFGLYDVAKDLNWDTKNKNKYAPNESITYSSLCLDTKKLSVINITVAKIDEEQRPLELLVKEENFDECDGLLQKSETKTGVLRYECK